MAAITMQPQFVVPAIRVVQSEWQSDVCDCCTDCGVCICGAFCYTCLGCQVASDMDECCMCGGSIAMRTKYRTKYHIPGSILNDFMMSWCCPHCTLCQLKRDINMRKAQGTF
ncbi:placenta-specific gene 8 protein [Ambystoma mexicanum]|uniref:placenta-specific gene 8 protein n=1 Tax=Ambystoma mexicanum TaxID=8296 RepID=UPI0037E7EE53